MIKSILFRIILISYDYYQITFNNYIGMHKYTRKEKSVMNYFPVVSKKIQADSFTLGGKFSTKQIDVY
jgi:hypothetical protein